MNSQVELHHQCRVCGNSTLPTLLGWSIKLVGSRFLGQSHRQVLRDGVFTERPSGAMPLVALREHCGPDTEVLCSFSRPAPLETRYPPNVDATPNVFAPRSIRQSILPINMPRLTWFYKPCTYLTAGSDTIRSAWRCVHPGSLHARNISG